MNKLICLAPLVCVLVSAAPVRGQGCCTPGSSPLGGLSGGALHSRQLEVGFAFEGYRLHQGYEGSVQVQDPARRESTVYSTTAFARFGISSRAALILQLPLEHRQRSAPAIPEKGQPSHDFSNTAIGDLTTLFMIQALPIHGPSAATVNLGLGVKWRTGHDDRKQDGLRLPVELQTGTGSNDPVFALVAYRLFTWGSVSGSAVIRTPQRGRSGYRFGRELNYDVLALLSLGTRWSLGSEIRGRSASADDFRDVTRENTGGSRLLVGPRAIYALASAPLTIEAAFLLPAWQNLTGEQLGVNEQATIGLRWRTF